MPLHSRLKNVSLTGRVREEHDTRAARVAAGLAAQQALRTTYYRASGFAKLSMRCVLQDHDMHARLVAAEFAAQQTLRTTYDRAMELAAAAVAAQNAVQRIYKRAFKAANQAIPRIQQDENLQRLPWSWVERKGRRNAYVMVRGLMNGDCHPVVLICNDDVRPGLSYRQLYVQLRAHIGLEKKQSLRVCSDRPWYRYCTRGIIIPEHELLPVHDASCSSLFGTTLLYYTYVHLREEDEALCPCCLEILTSCRCFLG